ncbi:MAG: hypothetical protein ACI4MJ_03465 [Aristaeellaceae bacterium]
MSMPLDVEGHALLFHNQRHSGWTHPYPYHGGETLHNSGCGVFALCHCLQWMTGQIWEPEPMADLSVACGGRGDDGTNRPGLLAGLESCGMARRMGFAWHGGGLENDIPRLVAFLREEQGVAMANLRVGHIVALLAVRELAGMQQLLVVDSYSESNDPRVSSHVTAVLPGSKVIDAPSHAADEPLLLREQYAAYWVNADCARDYTLLHRIEGS